MPHPAIARIDRATYKTTLQAGSHALLADEPAESGGSDLGPAPGELLRMSLAACTAITLRMYADRKGWALEEASVEVDFEKTESGGTLFRCRVQLAGDLDEAQRNRLMQVAGACPVHKILTHPIEIQTVA